MLKKTLNYIFVLAAGALLGSLTTKLYSRGRRTCNGEKKSIFRKHYTEIDLSNRR